MAGASNFFVFNEVLKNVLDDEAYQNNIQRQAGVVPGLADSKLHNKLYHQTSIMAAAIAEVIKRKGLSAMDTDLEALVNAVKGTFIEPFAQKADITEWKLLPLVCDSGSKLYYKKIDKLVCMKGVVVWNSTQNLPQTIAVLPEGFRPYPSVSMLTMKRGVYEKIGFVSISIESDGNIVLIASSTDPQIVTQSGGLDLNITFSIN